MKVHIQHRKLGGICRYFCAQQKLAGHLFWKSFRYGTVSTIGILPRGSTASYDDLRFVQHGKSTLESGVMRM